MRVLFQNMIVQSNWKIMSLFLIKISCDKMILLNYMKAFNIIRSIIIAVCIGILIKIPVINRGKLSNIFMNLVEQKISIIIKTYL